MYTLKVNAHSELNEKINVLGFRVWGLGFRIWGLGFRVSGLGMYIRNPCTHCELNEKINRGKKVT